MVPNLPLQLVIDEEKLRRILMQRRQLRAKVERPIPPGAANEGMALTSDDRTFLRGFLAGQTSLFNHLTYDVRGVEFWLFERDEVLAMTGRTVSVRMQPELTPSEVARMLARRPRKPRQTIQVSCAYCQKRFEAARATRQYCSKRCAMAGWRRKIRQEQQEGKEDA